MQLVLEGQAERVKGPLVLVDQTDPELLLRLGRLAQRRAPAVAEPFFARAVELRPEQASAHEQRGANLLLLERHEAAAAAFSEAVRLDPSDADSMAHLALCEAKLNRIPEARAHTRAALALDPGHQLAQQLATALQIR